MDTRYEVDLDNEKIRFEGEWMGRSDLAEKIRRMIDSQDFRIGTAGAALEHLQNCLNSSRKIEVKMTPDEADLLEKHAGRAGLEASALARQAIQAYLAAQPPIDEGEQKPAASSFTTEPAKPGDEAQAVELTNRKEQTSSKVLVDPSMNAETTTEGEN